MASGRGWGSKDTNVLGDQHLAAFFRAIYM